MKILSPFTREYWIEDADVRKAVGPLPPRDAILQAACSAVSVEDDRRSTRLLEIDQALSRMEWDKAHITRAMKVLREERALLEVSTHG